MKYKRLTKRISDDEEAFLFHSSLHEGIQRLAELEDKIERGELISTKEYSYKKIEYLVKHNEQISKLTAEDIFSWIYDNLVNANFVTGNAEISMWALQNKAAEYGIDFFNNK